MIQTIAAATKDSGCLSVLRTTLGEDVERVVDGLLDLRDGLDHLSRPEGSYRRGIAEVAQRASGRGPDIPAPVPEKPDENCDIRGVSGPGSCERLDGGLRPENLLPG